MYEYPSIDILKIKNQFSDCINVRVDDYGLMYITFREGRIDKRGPGFGRRSQVGLDENSKISLVKIPWNEPGAGIPHVDSLLALDGLLYHNGLPEW